MSDEDYDKHLVLLEALEAGGYAPGAIKAAVVAARRNLGARTTEELVAAADPAAGRVVAAILGSTETDARTSRTVPQTYEEGIKQMDNDLRAACGFPTSNEGDPNA